MANYLFLVWSLHAGALASQAPPSEHEWRVSDRPFLTLGAIEGDRSDLFGDVAGAVRFSSGEVVVADRIGLDVRVFSAEGRVSKTAGGRGEGPGEFRTIKSMRRCAADAVFVYDSTFPRVSVFGLDGSLVRTIPVMKGRLPPYDFFCNNGAVLVYIHRSSEPPAGVGPRRPTVAITLTNRNDEAVLLGRFPASERYFNGSEDFPRPLGKRTSAAVGSHAVYVGTGDFIGTSDTFEIVMYSFRGERVGVVRDTVSREQISTRHRRRFIEEQVSRFQADQQRGVKSFLEGLEYPEIFPAYGVLLTDPSDNLWVQNYPRPGEDIRTWRVYSRRGIRINTVRTPKGFRLLEVGDDYILGVRKNELDVAFVEVYRLIKPTMGSS